MNDKAYIINALRAWVNQEARLNPADYGGNGLAFAEERRGIARDGEEALALIAAVEAREEITARAILEEMPRCYSGRLSWVNGRLQYITGQYWPTEYRKAACAVLASVLWGIAYNITSKDSPECEREAIRSYIRSQFGFGDDLFDRWFN